MNAQQGIHLGKIIAKIGGWLKKIFKVFKDDIAKVSVSITQAIKESLDNGFLPDIAQVIDNLTNSHIASSVVDYAAKNVNKWLAVELGINGLSDEPTFEEIEEFSANVAQAFGSLSFEKRSKILTELAIFVRDELKELKEDDGVLSWADKVKIVQDAYFELMKLKAENE